MKTNPSIFKAYDIRGIYPDGVNEETAYKIGRAVVNFLKCKSVAVGQDMRKSSPKLFVELSRGINDQGADIIDIGMCTTPMLHFSVAKFGYEAGVMISASHNPSQYNGFKIDKKNGIQLSNETGLQKIERLVKKNKFKETSKEGKIIKKDILNDYVDHILNFAENVQSLKVVVDYGNGVGAISAQPVFEKLNVDVIPMYEEPDDAFPNHIPNPHDVENLKDLQQRVKQEKADLGIFFDGDADRASFVDENGEIIFSDFIFGILTQEELRKNPGQKIYYDLRFSWAVRDAIKQAGGVPVMMKVGNPFYKEALNKEGILAGELSGHIMFKENFCIDDGLFSVIKLMNIICQTGKTLSELIKPFKKYYKTEEINLKVKDKQKTLKKLEKQFSDGKISRLDGLTVEYQDWWFNLRPSNTEPLLRLNVEAKTKEMLEEKRVKLIELIE